MLGTVFLLTAPTAAHATAPPPPTAQGLRAFQQSYGLDPTGRVDTATARLLGSAPTGELRTVFADRLTWARNSSRMRVRSPASGRVPGSRSRGRSSP
ncbi:hypothetical protein SMICM17S_11714 [Streptomyces microflavus]